MAKKEKRKKNKKKTAVVKTDKERRQEAHTSAVYTGIMTGLVLMYFIAYSYVLTGSFLLGISDVFAAIPQGHLLFRPTVPGLLAGGLCGAIVGFVVWLLMSSDYDRREHYRDEEVAGTGGFMDKEEMQEYSDEYISEDPPALVPKVTEEGVHVPIPYDKEKDREMYSQNMIMSDHFCRPINSRRIQGNNNVLIVGGAGSGKSRFVIKPNMLQMNASYVITDPSGEMIFSLGQVLADHGYKIKVFNISDMEHSDRYNPLVYVRDAVGVNSLIDCLITNTTQGKGGAGDNQFFVDAEKLLYAACLYYMMDFCEDTSVKNFAGVMSIINASSVDEGNANTQSDVDVLFGALPESSLARKNYRAFKQAAGKTLKSIIISCVTRLRPFLTPEIANLTSDDTLHLENLAFEKTALFIITPQADRTNSFLASMLYSQLFETLYHIAEERKRETGSEELPIPVRCLMDEFANIGEIPEFPQKLATMRKYNISATIVLQDISQIEAMYDKEWKTLTGNCSSTIFLGSPEPDTLKYFSEKLGEETIRSRSSNLSGGQKGGSSQGFQNTSRKVMTAEEMGRMPSDECIVFTQNMRPVRDQKYHYEKHPYYPQTADGDDANGFNYANLSCFNVPRAREYSSLISAMQDASEISENKMTLQSKEDGEETEDVTEILENNPLGEKERRDRISQEEANAVLQAVSPKSFISSEEKGITKIRMVTVRNVAPEDLYPVACFTADHLRLPSLIVLDDMDTAEDYLCAVALDRASVGLSELLKTKYTENLRDEKDVLVFSISRHVLDKFEEEVTERWMRREET